MAELDHRIALAGRPPPVADPTQLLGTYLRGRGLKLEERRVDQQGRGLELEERRVDQQGRGLELEERRIDQQGRKFKLEQEIANLDKQDRSVKTFTGIARWIRSQGYSKEAIEQGKKLLQSQGHDMSGVPPDIGRAQIDMLISQGMSASEQLQAQRLKLDQKKYEEEIPRAVEKLRAEAPLLKEIAAAQGEEAAKWRAAAQKRAAEIQLKTEQLKVLMPSPEERKFYRGILSTGSAVNNLLEGINNPKVQGILGTIFEDPVAFSKRLASGQVPAAATREERQFLADLAKTAGDMRRQLVGLAQTNIEMRNLVDFIPTKNDTTDGIRAKLTTIRDSLNREEDALLATLEAFNVRRPGPRTGRPGEAPPPGNDPNDPADTGVSTEEILNRYRIDLSEPLPI